MRTDFAPDMAAVQEKYAAGDAEAHRLTAEIAGSLSEGVALLAAELRTHGDGTTAARGCTLLCEEAVRRHAEASGFSRFLLEHDLALAACGGTGAWKMGPKSDLDYVIVGRDDALDQLGGAALREFSGRLERQGFSWEPLARSPADVEEFVRISSLPSLTALLSARFVLGSAAACEGFLAAFAACMKEHGAAVIERLREETAERHQAHDATVKTDMMNVKEAPGGLRDLDAIDWFDRLSLHAGHDRDLLRPREREAVEKARRYIMAVKFALHLAANGSGAKLGLYLPTARQAALVFEALPPVAGPAAPGGAGLTRLHEQCEIVHHALQTALLRLSPAAHGAQAGSVGSLRRRLQGLRQQGSGPQIAEACMQLLTAPAAVNEGPARRVLVNEAREAAEDLHVSDFMGPQAAAARMKLLSSTGAVAPMIRALWDARLLERSVPELAGLRNHHPLDGYHDRTLDKHILKALECMDQIAAGKLAPFNSYAESAAADWSAIYLALLLHDCQKTAASPIGHEELAAGLAAQKACSLGMSRGQIEKVERLVRHHSDMALVSQGFLTPAEIERFAALAGDRDFLFSLFVLTYADKASSNPGRWTPSKAAWLTDLHDRTAAWLEARDTGRPPLASIEERAHELAVLCSRQAETKHLAPADFKAHLMRLPQDYSFFFDQSVVQHVLMAQELAAREGGIAAERGKYVMRLLPPQDVLSPADARKCSGPLLLIVARAEPGLFGRVGRALAWCNINITQGMLETREDGVACNLFALDAPGYDPNDPFDRDRILRKVQDVLERGGEMPLSLRAVPEAPILSGLSVEPSVSISPGDGPGKLVVEVCTEDQIGLAGKLGEFFASQGLTVVAAKLGIGTRGVRDICTVRPFPGRGAQLSVPALRAALLAELRPPAPPGSAWQPAGG